MKGLVIRSFGDFEVTDDGTVGRLYGVWRKPSGGLLGMPTHICSGLTLAHAKMVAEALHNCKAGTRGSTLTEDKLTKRFPLFY